MTQSSATIDDFFAYCTDMVFIAEEGGALLRRSRALLGALDPELEEAGPRGGLAPLVHPDDRSAFDEMWGRLRAKPEPAAVELRLKTRDGTFKAFRCTARWVPERGEIYGTLHDAEERIKHDIKLKTLQAITDHLPIALIALDAQGVFVIYEGKGLLASGFRSGELLGRNLFELFPPENTVGAREALTGKISHTVTVTGTTHWESWSLPVRNERGEITHVAGVTLDITEAKRTEQDLRAKLELIQKQQQVIRSLSTPIIQVWDRVLTLPLMGTFDSTRAAEVMDNVLTEVVRTRARYTILDLTGVEAMDTATVSHLLKLAQAIRLLGAEGIITGIHPAIAQTIIGLGVDLSTVVTLATLQEGLRFCIQRMTREVR